MKLKISNDFLVIVHDERIFPNHCLIPFAGSPLAFCCCDTHRFVGISLNYVFSNFLATGVEKNTGQQSFYKDHLFGWFNMKLSSMFVSLHGRNGSKCMAFTLCITS